MINVYLGTHSVICFARVSQKLEYPVMFIFFENSMCFSPLRWHIQHNISYDQRFSMELITVEIFYFISISCHYMFQQWISVISSFQTNFNIKFWKCELILHFKWYDSFTWLHLETPFVICICSVNFLILIYVWLMLIRFAWCFNNKFNFLRSFHHLAKFISNISMEIVI